MLLQNMFYGRADVVGTMPSDKNSVQVQLYWDTLKKVGIVWFTQRIFSSPYDTLASKLHCGATGYANVLLRGPASLGQEKLSCWMYPDRYLLSVRNLVLAFGRMRPHNGEQGANAAAGSVSS